MTMRPISGTDEYDVPTRAVLSKVRDVLAQAQNAPPYVSLPYLEPERRPFYATGQSQGSPSMWDFRMDKVVLIPTPDGSYPVRIRYFRRPSQIVSSGYSVPSGLAGATLTVASTTGMSTGNFDVVSSNAPFDPVLDDIAGTVAGGTTLTLTLTADQSTTLTAAITAGCWIVAAGDTPAPNMMSPEIITLLVQAAAATIGAAMGSPSAPGAFAQRDATLARIRTAMLPREGGLGRKVVGASRLGRGAGPWGVTSGWGS